MNNTTLSSALILTVLSAGAWAEGNTLFGMPTEYTLGVEGFQQNFDTKATVNDDPLYLKRGARVYDLTGSVRMRFSDSQAVKLSARVGQSNGDIESNVRNGDRVAFNHDTGNYDLRGVYQYTLQLGSLPLTTSAGLGYRNQSENWGQSTSNSEEERSSSINRGYTYATVGVESTFALGDNWLATPKLSFNKVLNGQQSMTRNTKSTDWRGVVSTSSTNASANHNRGYGYELASDFSVKVGGNKLSLTPFYRYWHIDATPASLSNSNGNANFQLPSNSTKEVGLNLSLAF